MKRFGVAAFAVVLVACSAPPVTSDAGMLGPAPSFSLTDVNPSSASAGQAISPSSFSGKVTGWYFGHSS